MIILLSPAKTFDFSRQINSIQHSEACFNDETNRLADVMRSYSKTDLLQVMNMSEKLAELTYQRFQDWYSGDVEEKQAGAAFKGEAYAGLDLPSLDEEALDFAQNHLRILSGMYGILRPYDIIKPYRLEMGAKLKTDSLYKYWKEKVTKAINEDANNFGEPIINLSSSEYFNVLDKQMLNTQVITPWFKENKNGVLKTIVVYTKKARGMMARFIIQNRLKTSDELKMFNAEGYRFNAELSVGNTLLFTR